MNNIKILDCTLRDGGYVNDWKFKDDETLQIIKSLEKTNIDIIECGYLNKSKGESSDSTKFSSLSAVDSLLVENTCDSKKVIMINYLDYKIDDLPNSNDTKIDGIRFAFHKKDLFNVLEEAKKIIEKGYLLFFQPMVTVLYTNEEFIELISIVNELKPYSFYIVDSFGSMDHKTLLNYVDISCSYLLEEIVIGFHSHNNLQLAYSNSITFINNISHRDIIIDSTIYGMGRGAGNLNTELICDFLNNNFNKQYNVEMFLDVIDDYLESIHEEKYWGFSLAYYLSGKLKVHPNYATYLVNKKSITVKGIDNILSNILKEKSFFFDQDYIKSLFINYFKNESNHNLKVLDENMNVLVIASGHSTKSEIIKIKDFIEENKQVCIITVNHKNDDIKSDYYFFSNQKRFNEFKDTITTEDKLLLTSNIEDDKPVKNKKINFNYLYEYMDINNDNVTIMLLNLLNINKVKKVFIAGLDGYNIHSDCNYSYLERARSIDKDYLLNSNKNLELSLNKINKLMDIELITSSLIRLKNER